MSSYASCRLLLMILFLAAPASVIAQMPNMQIPHTEQDTKTADMRELVSKYCRFDYEGARLSEQGWTKMEPLVSWKTNQEYVEMNVISRYSVDQEVSENHGKYTVTVHYRLLGSYNLVTGYVPEPPSTQQTVQFTVTDNKGDFRIMDSENSLPHPSRTAMLKWLNEKLGSAQDDAAKRRYEEALRQLQAQPASPFAK
jgi:hypothetical protein